MGNNFLGKSYGDTKSLILLAGAHRLELWAYGFGDRVNILI